MPELEQKTVELPIDANLEAETQKLKDEGWDLVPGTKPMATYHLVRAKREAAPAVEGEPAPNGGMALGIMQIDDRLVHVVKAKPAKKK